MSAPVEDPINVKQRRDRLQVRQPRPGAPTSGLQPVEPAVGLTTL